MLVYVFLFSFLVSAVRCQSYQQQVNDKLNAVESSKASLVSNFTGLRTNLLAAQNAITTLNSSLSAAIFNDILSESINMMDILAADQTDDEESVCFGSYLASRSTIVPAAQQSFNFCAFLVNSRISQQIVVLNSNIALLNSTATTARQKLSSCNTIRFQTSQALFNYCLKSGTSDYDSKITAITPTVAALTTKKNSFVSDLNGCISATVIASQNQLKSIIESVTTCLQSSTTPDAAQLVAILPSVSVNSANFISEQVTSATNASVELSKVKNEYNSVINDAKKEVDIAVNVKSLKFTNAKAALDYDFATTKTEFDKAMANKSSVPAAASCVNNIRNALYYNINRYTDEYVTCVANIRSGPLSYELAQVQSVYDIVAREGESTMQCISQTTNIVSAAGIQQCREDLDADAANYISYLTYRALTLKEEAILVARAAERCKSITFNNVKRQNQKDKQHFENCIFRTTKEIYLINLP